MYTKAQEAAIVNARYKYVWQIRYANGDVVDQLGPDGSESRIDFERPMAEASWLPTVAGLQSATVELKPNHRLILSRRTCLWNGTQFIASYVIGVADREHIDDPLSSSVWFVSPPAEGIVVRANPDTKERRQEIVRFDGAIEKCEGNFQEFRSQVQLWLEREDPHFAQ